MIPFFLWKGDYFNNILLHVNHFETVNLKLSEHPIFIYSVPFVSYYISPSVYREKTLFLCQRCDKVQILKFL